MPALVTSLVCTSWEDMVLAHADYPVGETFDEPRVVAGCTPQRSASERRVESTRADGSHLARRADLTGQRGEEGRQAALCRWLGERGPTPKQLRRALGADQEAAPGEPGLANMSAIIGHMRGLR